MSPFSKGHSRRSVNKTARGARVIDAPSEMTLLMGSMKFIKQGAIGVEH
jgi:hypothetical protein